MVKFYNSIMFRITLSFFLLVLIITGFTLKYAQTAAEDALLDTIKGELRHTADAAAAQFTPEDIEALKGFEPGDESSPEFLAILNKLYLLRRDNPDVTEFYSMKLVGPEEMVFVLDDWRIDDETGMDEPTEPSLINDPYADYDPSVLIAFDGITSVSEDIYTDEWGSFLSGNAPIKDAAGNVVGVISVDMDVSTVQEKITFLGNLVYFLMFGAILAAALLIFIITMTIARDLKKLTDLANRVSSGDIVSEFPEIRSKNEVYELNEGLKSMVAAVNMLKEAVGIREAALNKEKETAPAKTGKRKG